jgi:hypothetical protein
MAQECPALDGEATPILAKANGPWREKRNLESVWSMALYAGEGKKGVDLCGAMGKFAPCYHITLKNRPQPGLRPHALFGMPAMSGRLQARTWLSARIGRMRQF